MPCQGLQEGGSSSVCGWQYVSEWQFEWHHRGTVTPVALHGHRVQVGRIIHPWSKRFSLMAMKWSVWWYRRKVDESILHYMHYVSRQDTVATGTVTLSGQVVQIGMAAEKVSTQGTRAYACRGAQGRLRIVSPCLCSRVTVMAYSDTHIHEIESGTTVSV